MRARLPVLICAALSVGLSVVAAGPASAAPLEREHYSDSFEETFDCDGLVMLHLSSEFSGLFMLKEGKQEGPPRYFDNYSFVDTYTNVDTDKWVTVSGNGNFRDLKITHVEGTTSTYEYVARFSGQGNIVRDMEGNVLLRSAGSGTVHAVIDTKGDTNIDNDEELFFEVVRETGRDDTAGRDFCEDMLLFTS